ncbi:hypothetical protein V8E54_004288 [Elaphomyces granulatus]
MEILYGLETAGSQFSGTEISIYKSRTEREDAIYNVAYCENFAANLVSFRQLRSPGYWCITVYAMLTRPWWQIYANITTNLSLRHPGPQALEHLVNASKGVRLSGIKSVNCDACGMAKAERRIRREPREFKSATIISSLNTSSAYLNGKLKKIECDNEIFMKRKAVLTWLQTEQHVKDNARQCTSRKTASSSMAGDRSPDDTLTPEVHEQAYFGNNRRKLRDIKQTWDPDKFFRWSQGVRLPAEAKQQNAASTSGETNSDLSADQVFIKEEALTDLIALQQWESYRPPTPTDFSGSGALPALVY